MRNFKTEAIILKRHNIGEADRIITVFTKRFGKIKIKAQGVRRITSRRSPHIEVFNVSQLTLYKGSYLPILTEAQTTEDFSEIKNDLTKVGFAYHICEIVDGLCPENQENPAIFSLLFNTLKKLSQEQDIVVIIHEFEVELLQQLGYWSSSRNSLQLDTQAFIENILERKLKSKRIISKLYS